MLKSYRVIDLSNELGLLCGQILADLGADVIQVEPPGGSTARLVGPWLKGERGPERSLFWWAYARNKRSLVIDFESEADLAELRRLASGADFFIESDRPGALAELGLGYDDLRRENPALVYISITPFGQTGPKAQWAATDLTQVSAGGIAFLSGEADMPPVRASVPQAHAHAGADAAVAALIALAERKRSGLGQHIDVSLQQSVTLATMFRALDAPLEEAPARRISGGIEIRGVFLQSRFELRDGWVVLGPGILPSTGHFMRRLLEWVAEEGYCDPALAEEEWGTFAFRLVSGQVEKDAFVPAEVALRSFFAERTKAELMNAAVERKLLIAPMLGLDEIIDSDQMASRGFPVDLLHPASGEAGRYPGPFAKFSASPIVYRRPAPTLGEHGEEIRAEARRAPFAPVDRAPVSDGAPISDGAPVSDGAPLAGVKILDLFWILAGPGGTRMLADYGAEVVHVESTRHLDTLRVIPPYQFNVPHPEGAGGFQCANANKLGITLDLASPEGREIALGLVAWADVVTESFAPGIIDHYGLGWETLRAVKPDLIMISSCLMGQSGPWRDFTGFGNLAASVTGFQQIASWPERALSGPYGAYTDFIAVRYNALAILAALEYRDRTGKGQYIDQSQAESALHFLAPAFLDYSLNGQVPKPAGNYDADLSPHGIYPCRGKDRWIAIAVDSDAAWHALCEQLGRSDLEPQRTSTAIVDEAISGFTRDRDATETAEALQAVGIPAHPVFNTTDLYGCPQLRERGHYVETRHEIYQTTTIESSRLRLSRSPARVPESALNFGRDNREVLERILGYSPDRIADLAERGILT